MGARMLAPIFLFSGLLAAAEPFRTHPANPHYFEFRGKPTVLITSAEHYGAVLNGAFNYTKYLDTLAKDGLNHTRLFAGPYRETPGAFGILRNTLAPQHDQYISPWTGSPATRFDLKTWNPAFFARLKDFVAQAGKRGIVVEVTLFCTYYKDEMWKLSPMHESQNRNGVGAGVKHDEVLTMKHPDLLAVQTEFTRKMVSELREFDNVYFEICNEPYFAGVTAEWQAHIARTIKAVGTGHLISQNVANGKQLVTTSDPNVGLLNFHYARPPATVAMNWHLNRPIGMNETGFDGTLDSVYRIQAWDFLLAGGALYNNLDYSFATGAEDGSFPVPGDQPGGGSPALRQQLGGLMRFMKALDFVRMSPDANLITGDLPPDTSARGLGQPGRYYAFYVQHGRILPDYRPRYAVNTRKRTIALTIQIPGGEYKVDWWNPRTGKIERTETLRAIGGAAVLTSPEYTEDVAVTLTSLSK